MKINVGDKIPDAKVLIIDKEHKEISVKEILSKDKVVLFGLPGAFTPTCSEKHMPSFIQLHQQLISKGINDIYCLSVNDKFVMNAWLLSYAGGDKIIGIADGNGEICQTLNLLVDKSKYFMGMRSKRFSMIVKNNIIENTFIEEPGEYKVSSAEHLLTVL